jgi:hypothetical protein
MDGGGKSSVEIPTYNKPNAASFSMFGNTASKSGDNWNYSTSGLDQQTMNQAKQIRQQLISALGVNRDEGNSQYYQNTYNKELLRQSQPQLENALIGRGMGGSSVYGNALSDLFSKAATQSVLGRQQYQSNEQGMNINQLSALQNYLQQENQTGLNMLGLGANYDIQNQRLAQEMYNTQLPYLAKVNQEDGTPWGSIGSLAGAGLGALFALPTGGMSVAAGAGLGSSLGRSAGGLFGGGSNSGGGGMDLSWLMKLLNSSSSLGGGGSSNIAGNSFATSGLGSLGGF